MEPIVQFIVATGAALTAGAATYLANTGRKALNQFEKHERMLFGEERVDGMDGIVSIALGNERRSLENRRALHRNDLMEEDDG